MWIWFAGEKWTSVLMLALYLVVPLPLMNHSINEEKEPLSLLKVLIYLDLVNSVLEPHFLNLLCAYRIATKSIPANGSINQLQLRMQS